MIFPATELELLEADADTENSCKGRFSTQCSVTHDNEYANPA